MISEGAQQDQSYVDLIRRLEFFMCLFETRPVTHEGLLDSRAGEEDVIVCHKSLGLLGLGRNLLALPV